MRSAEEYNAADRRVRDAIEADLPAIVDIGNLSIPAGWFTADTLPITVAGRVEWFRKFDSARWPIWVAEVEGLAVATAYHILNWAIGSLYWPFVPWQPVRNSPLSSIGKGTVVCV